VVQIMRVYARPWALRDIREATMPRLVTRGRFTHDYLKGCWTHRRIEKSLCGKSLRRQVVK
jgi:hypothetical protein